MKPVITFFVIITFAVPASGCIFGRANTPPRPSEEEIAQEELAKRRAAAEAHALALKNEPVPAERVVPGKFDAALITPEEETRLRELADLSDVDALMEQNRRDACLLYTSPSPRDS